MKINIVMYHYIKDFSKKENKGYKGISLKKFDNHINYLKKNYIIIDIKNLLDSNFIKEHKKGNYCLLTFDDGYIDHFQNVFPILVEKKVTGSFYMSGSIIENKKLLNVNKIHYLLANIKKKEIIKNLKIFCAVSKRKINFEKIYNNLKNNTRYDDDDINLIKYLLNIYFSIEERDIFFQNIFEKIIQIKEEDISKNFYLSKKNIKEMQKFDMYFGGHGYEHYNLTSLNQLKLKIELNKTINFLKKINTRTDNWIMCYPYGAYNNKILKSIKRNNCSIGLTTLPFTANLNKKNLLTLPRFDANDVGYLL